MRFGFAFHGGHTRYMGRRDVTVMNDPGGPAPVVRRWNVLAHTDVALGPHFQVPAGPLLLEFGAGGASGVSSYNPGRRRRARPRREHGRLQRPRPGRRDARRPDPQQSGVAIGLDLQKYFSSTRVVTVPDAPMGAPPDSVVFDLTLAVTLAYQMWF
jgi:hypothetical protein